MDDWNHRPSTYDSGAAICERLEAVLDELRKLRVDMKQPSAVRLSADDIHSMSRRR